MQHAVTVSTAQEIGRSGNDQDRISDIDPTTRVIESILRYVAPELGWR